MRVFLSMGMT